MLSPSRRLYSRKTNLGKTLSKFSMLTVIVIVVLFCQAWADNIVKGCDGTTNQTVWNCISSNLTELPTISLGSNHLHNFHTLNFANNKITKLGKLNFSTNNEVNELLLSRNLISSIDLDAFEEMTRLGTLDLSMNKINGDILDEKQFVKLTNIKTLNMSWNPLRLITKNIFSIMDFDSLTTLDLSHCQIKRIEDGAFMLLKLKVLDLSWNELEHFHGHAFRSLRKLESLNLSHNRFTTLNEMPNLPNIEVINFDYNMISRVMLKEAMGYGTQMLEQLNMRNNELKTFTKNGFDWGLKNLDAIYLDNNPIECDCQMQWVVNDEDIKSRNFTIPCSSPSNHRGKNLLTIPAQQLICDITPIHPHIISVSLVVCLPLAITLAFVISVYLTVKRKCRKSRGRNKRSKRYGGANYTSVYTKEGEEMMVYLPKYEQLVNEVREFDV